MSGVKQFELVFRKQLDLAEPKQLLKRLNFQRDRIFKPADGDESLINPQVHHADFYTILLRRLLRWLNNIGKVDQRVSSLLRKNNDLLGKIWIRDDFEHGVKNVENLPITDSRLLPQGAISSNVPVKIVISVMIGRTSDEAVIASGNVLWDLNADHTRFVGIIEDVFSLYPFDQPPPTSVP
ncbi:MAG: hypothetical protein Q8R32_00920 [bacterium]|nr:hypothetical protein [bacterium]